jgi:hypothetical protein
LLLAASYLDFFEASYLVFILRREDQDPVAYHFFWLALHK